MVIKLRIRRKKIKEMWINFLSIDPIFIFIKSQLWYNVLKKLTCMIKFFNVFNKIKESLKK